MKWAISKEATQSQHDSGDHEVVMCTQTPAQGCSPHHSPCYPKAKKTQMPINDGQKRDMVSASDKTLCSTARLKALMHGIA